MNRLGLLFMNGNGDSRKLIIIDECIDLIEHSQGSLMGLKQTLAVIPPDIEEEFPEEVRAIEKLANMLKEVDQQKRKTGSCQESLISEVSLLDNPPDLTLLRDAMRKKKCDMIYYLNFALKIKKHRNTLTIWNRCYYGS